MTSTPEFETIVRAIRPQLVRYVGRLVGDADADDVVQIVLSKASSAIADFRGDASPRTWLFRIATNSAHDWNRSRRVTVSEPVESASEEDDAVGRAEDASQERQVVREEMSQCVGEVLGRLAEGYRVVLALSDCEELSDREVAAVLGLSLGAAKIRLHRARTRMKEELERVCSFYHDAENTLCCDRKGEPTERKSGSDQETRHQMGRRITDVAPEGQNDEFIANMGEPLPIGQKQLIGVGAGIAAGCHPCTSSYVAAAQVEGACARGIRFAIESGLSVREVAIAATQCFARETFACPELDAAFREERALLGALIKVAAAIASNAASSLLRQIETARALGANDDQIRIAAQIARNMKRGAENETEAALRAALGDASSAATSSSRGGCDCSSNSTKIRTVPNAATPQSAVSASAAGAFGRCGKPESV